jgi:tyrosine decarboxylase/aspartate 1-decarboxylase
VLAEIESLCGGDYSYASGRILNSICSQPLPLAVEAYRRMIHTNLGDGRIFPGVARIEGETTRMLGELLGCPAAAGNLVAGGTEGNLLALLAARVRAGQNGTAQPEVVVPYSIHFSVEKAATILGLKLRFTRLDPCQRAEVEDIEKNISSRTIAILATAGTSEFGAVDDIPAIAEVARRRGLYFHVDAASGGLIIPFAQELGYPFPPVDFTVEGVDSITVDPHKYGFSLIPSGYILFRHRETQQFHFQSHYRGTPAHHTLSGTRCGANAVSVYATLKHLGREGYKDIVRGYFEKRDHLVHELRQAGLELMIPPEMNIVTIKSKRALEVTEQLEAAGWLVSLLRRYDALRVVVHHHHDKEHLTAFVEKLAEIEASLAA